jgi:hypothetical protein
MLIFNTLIFNFNFNTIIINSPYLKEALHKTQELKINTSIL